MAYSEQFYKEIIDNLPESIVEYFNFNKSEFNLSCYTIEEFVKEVIEEKFMNYSHRESLAPIAAKLEKAKRDKYAYVYSHYAELLGLKEENPKNPLHGFRIRTMKEKKDSFGRADITYDEAVTYRLNECMEWRQSKSLLTGFEGLHFLSRSVRLSCLKIDVLLFFWNYIEERYNGNPSSFYVKRIFPDVPLIGLRSCREEALLPSTGISALSSFPISVTNANGISVKIKPSDFLLKNLRSLDPDSIMVLSVIINHIQDMGEFSLSRTVKIPLSVIKREAFDYDNKYVVNKIRSIIEYLSIIKIEYWEKGATVPSSISVFDKTSFPEVGKNVWAEVRFGSEVASDIVGDNIYCVPKMEYMKLSNPAAKILCHSLKKEQVRVNRETLDLYFYYDYSYFVGKVRFSSSNKRDNIKEIAAAFEDYVQNGIIVDSYVVEGVSGIHVYYIPLEPD